MHQNILITGATGFLGKVVLEKIVRNPEIRCFVTVRKPETFHFIPEDLGRSNIEEVNLDDDKILNQLFKEHSIDQVIHLATDYGNKQGGGVDFLDANLYLPLKILKIAVTSGTKNFINIDSFYNKSGNFQTRLFDYSQSKAALVPWLKWHSESIKVSNLVLEHMYGPGDGANKFIPKLIDSAKKNYQDNLKLSPGFQVRDFIFVEDVVDAIILLMENYDRILDKYQEIQVGTGIPTNLRSLADKINQILGIKAAPPFDQIPYAENEIMHSIADVSFLKSAGWVHKHSLQDGLKKTIDFN